MNTDDHDDLWDLLGKARQPSVSPFFSRNVLREVRALKQERPGVLAWLRRHWQVPAFAMFALAVSGGFFANRTSEERQLLALAERVSQSPDYQIITNLDELLESEENSVWLEENVY